MSSTIRSILDSPRADRAASVLGWTLLATAIAGLLYLIFGNPGKFPTYPIVIAAALAAPVIIDTLTLVRYTTTDPQNRGRLPLREITRALLVLAICFLIPQSKAGLYVCVALLALAAIITLIRTTRKQENQAGT